MKNLFEKFYGKNYETMAELIFGYLFLLMCLPFVAPYWAAKKGYIFINKKNGFNDHKADPNKDGVLYLNIISGILILVSIMNLFMSGNDKIPSSIYLITYLFGSVIVPFIYFLANIRIDYERKPKAKKVKEQKPSITAGGESIKYKASTLIHFQKNLEEFKQK